MPILHHGSNEGFSIVEAALSIFVAGVLLLSVISFATTTLKYSKKIIHRIDSYLEFQNNYAEKSI